MRQDQIVKIAFESLVLSLYSTIFLIWGGVGFWYFLLAISRHRAAATSYMQEPFPTTFHIKIVCGKALQPPGELRFILVAVFIKIAAQPDSTTIVKGQTLPLSTWVGAFLLQLYLGNGDYDG